MTKCDETCRKLMKMSEEETKTLTLHMSKSLWDQLHQIKQEDGIPVAIFVKKAVAERLDTWVRPSERAYGGDGL